MEKVISRLFDLYLIQHRHYLVQYPGGYYITRTPDQSFPIRRYMIEEHLEGKKTLGTFAGKYLTKFICFDVDYRNENIAKWITYKIVDTLENAGIRDYAVSFSGSKGYHIDIFLNKAISVQSARKFFELVVKFAEIDEGAEAAAHGQVEFRPTDKQGVKLPLGIHQKTGNYCGFCRIEDRLKVMDCDESVAFLFSLKKIDSNVVLDFIAENAPTYDQYDAEDMEDVVGKYTPLSTYVSVKKSPPMYSMGTLVIYD
ncbi:TOTE conflict system archaeo-eukaryotic primase domain-containing protein [Effusibacillus pohliae]|uniref:TOTE conflict system archaeo-eukaryotic primase domain-containing protein n=1 Tax=Effusibacillus pohliae TaxID=232270 RepID=UPI000361944B|nr:hypothetical protein [Effusibacillus pohliae]